MLQTATGTKRLWFPGCFPARHGIAGWHRSQSKLDGYLVVINLQLLFVIKNRRWCEASAMQWKAEIIPSRTNKLPINQRGFRSIWHIRRPFWPMAGPHEKKCIQLIGGRADMSSFNPRSASAVTLAATVVTVEAFFVNFSKWEMQRIL